MKKQLFAITLAMASLQFAVTATPSAMAATTLTVSMWRNDAPTARFTQAMFDDYTKRTGVRIKFFYVPWGQYLNKVLTMVTGGQAPDVMVLDRTMLPRFAQTGIVKPLDAEVEAMKFDPKKQLTETKSGFYNKKFYGFPIWGGPCLTYYNPTLFSQAGVPDPNQLIADNRWNWDTLVEYGRKLTKDTDGDGRPDTFALEALSVWEPDWVSKVRQNGGEVIDEGYKKAKINDPASIAGLQYWADLSWKWNIAPQPGQTGSFMGNKAAMRYGWISEAVTWKTSLKKRMDMQITMMPAGKAGYVHIAGGCPVAISKSSKNSKEAFRFAKWFALDSDEWKNVGAPASKATYEGEYQDYLRKYFTHPEMTWRAMENSGPEPVIDPRFQKLGEANARYLYPVITGTSSAAAAADKLAAEINRILSWK